MPLLLIFHAAAAIAFGSFAVTEANSKRQPAPKKPAIAIQQVQGKWTGTVHVEWKDQAHNVPITLSFHANGTVKASGLGRTRLGSFAIQGARILLTDAKTSHKAHLTNLKLTAKTLTGRLVPLAKKAAGLKVRLRLNKNH